MALKDVDEAVSVRLLANVLGITERWVQQLENNGVLQKSGRGRYPLAASVQAYIAWKAESEVDRRIDPTSADEMVKQERARKLKLENDARENILVDTPAAIAAVDVIVGMLRTDLAGVPARASEDVVTRRRVEDAINDVLGAVADRLEKAGADLRAGRDPLEADATVDA
ncbi:hypothetical protein ACO2I3_12300 [Leptospira interrogans]